MSAATDREVVEDPAALADAWDRLALASGNVFSTREWAETWWHHHGAGRVRRLVACSGPDERVWAILPLYLARRGPLRVVRFLGHGPADELGPVCAPEDRARAASALQATVRELGGDLFLGDRLAATTAWEGHLGGRVLRREPSPALVVAGRSWEEVLRDRSANFRQQVRRRTRRLGDAGSLELRLATGPAELDAALEDVFALHLRRWGAESSGGFATTERSFHRAFSRVALERGWLRLWRMELDGRSVAAWYGYRFAGAESYYQSGRDPAHDRLATGFVLLAHTIRAAVEDGMSEYRLLRGGEAYKSRFADDERFVETRAVPQGRAGRAAVRAATAALDLPVGLRRLVTERFA